MKKVKKIFAFALAAVMLSSVCLTASSCKKKGAKKKTILETDPFYTTKRIELDPKLSMDDFYDVIPMGPWMCFDKFAILYEVDNKPTEKNPYPESMSYLMGIFDIEGNLLQMVDLLDVMTSVRGTGAIALGLSEGEKGIRLYFENFASNRVVDPDTLSPGYESGLSETREYIYSCEFDSNTGEVIEEPHILRTDPDGAFFLSLSFIEGYEVGSAYCYDEERNIIQMIVVSRDGEPLYHVEIEDVFGPGVVRYVESIYGAGNSTAIINCMGYSTQLVAKLNLKTGEMTKLTDARPISDNQQFSSTKEGKGYITKATGIYEYDPTAAEEVCVLNYDHCDINRYESQTADVLSIKDNKVILGCSPRQEDDFLLPDPVPVYILEKAEKNPNAGKTVLTVASLSDSVTYFEGEALKTFNEQNPEYYVQLVLYDQNAYQTTGDATDDIDTSDRQMYSALSMVSGSLSMDIRSGDGPDVILGAASSIELLDSQYLMDLTSYLEGQKYDASKYYSKIIDASKIDGKMFFIPTSFTIAGILMDGSKMDEGQIGFTYDQYISYVENQLNGAEPVTEFISRMHFMNLCFERNYGQWVKDKKMNIEQEDFREMAAFFKDKIPEGVSVVPLDPFDTLDYVDTIEDPVYDAVFIENINGIGNLARYGYFENNLKVFGLPSENGTGPSANIVNSFSITEGSSVKDGAYALFDILLSEDIQKKSMDAIPINREAALYRVEKQKENNWNGYDFMTSPMVLYDPFSIRINSLYSPDLKFAEIFLETLDTVDTILLSDNAIMMIVDEELPAYLLGQKDLDSVIATINNRSTNVFHER